MVESILNIWACLMIITMLLSIPVMILYLMCLLINEIILFRKGRGKK